MIEDVVLTFGVILLGPNDVEHVGDEVGDALAHLGRIAHELHGFVDGPGSVATAARQNLVVLSVEVLRFLQRRVQARFHHWRPTVWCGKGWGNRGGKDNKLLRKGQKQSFRIPIQVSFIMRGKNKEQNKVITVSGS